jgi:hypothetical protein
MDDFDSVIWVFMDSSLYLPHTGVDLLSISQDAAFMATLVSGGDSRLAVDRPAGINKVFLPTCAGRGLDLRFIMHRLADHTARISAGSGNLFLVGTSLRERALLEQCSRDVAASLRTPSGAEVIFDAVRRGSSRLWSRAIFATVGRWS